MNVLPAQTRRFRWLLCLVVLALPMNTVAAERIKTDRLVVHEWGTFTALQDERGRELFGINVDDEPVPKFVHNLNRFVLAPAILSSEHWLYRMKGVPRQHSLVSMRLETPVIYFYPPPGQREPMPIDVKVSFRGGWLTEFYPNASASAPGLTQDSFKFGTLSPKTVGSLAWQNLQIGTEGRGPETDEHVWLAPRKTAAASVTTPAGESEKYLFYRGVGSLQAPLRVETTEKCRTINVFGNFDQLLKNDESVTIRAMWLVHVKDDGTTAFRAVGPVDASADPKESLATLRADFPAEAYGKDQRARLEEAMHGELVSDGLYGDEATALLSTWQRAYFTSPGLRLFYLVPREWTDHILPLSLSKPADIERVMVGRIEIVTNEQRELLAKLSKGPIADGRWVERIPESPSKNAFLAGRSSFGDLGVTIPDDYQTYLKLGRFRNALVVAEEARRPTESLKKFIDTNGLQPYRWKQATK